MMMVKKNYTLLSLLLFRTKKLKLSLSNSLYHPSLRSLSLSLFTTTTTTSITPRSTPSLHALTLLAASLAALEANSYPYSTHFPKATPLT